MLTEADMDIQRGYIFKKKLLLVLIVELRDKKLPMKASAI